MVARGGNSTGLQQLGMDTLWYIDADAGIDGVWDNSLAAEKPQYNADFTEMTVKLRDGIFWSDGVEFTADDVVYTVETQMKNPSMIWGPVFAASVDTVTAPDKHTVVFKLKRPNSRFHATVHRALERGLDHAEARLREGRRTRPSSTSIRRSRSARTSFTASTPTANGTSGRSVKTGRRTTLARFGEPGPKYAAYIDPGPPDKRVILQLNHQLDIIHDTSPEGVFTLVKQSPILARLVQGLPLRPSGPDACRR